MLYIPIVKLKKDDKIKLNTLLALCDPAKTIPMIELISDYVIKQALITGSHLFLPFRSKGWLVPNDRKLFYCVYNQQDRIRKIEADTPSGRYYTSTVKDADSYLEQVLALASIPNAIPTYMVDSVLTDETHARVFINEMHKKGLSCCMRIRTISNWALNLLSDLLPNDWVLFDAGSNYDLNETKRKVKTAKDRFAAGSLLPRIGILYENYNLEVSFNTEDFYHEGVEVGTMPFTQKINLSNRSVSIDNIGLDAWGDYCGQKNNLTERGGKAKHHIAFIYEYTKDSFSAFIDGPGNGNYSETKAKVLDYLQKHSTEYPVTLSNVPKKVGNHGDYWVLCAISYLEQMKAKDYKR